MGNKRMKLKRLERSSERGQYTDLRYLIIEKQRAKRSTAAGITDARDIINKKIAAKHHQTRTSWRRVKANKEEDFAMDGDIEMREVGCKSPQDTAKRLAYEVSVNNLHFDVTTKDIFQLFSEFGSLLEARVMCPGSAVVVFEEYSSASAACEELQNRDFDNQPMKLKMELVDLSHRLYLWN
ncbi:uncharacterized protein LOC115626139 isoform X2 [Scaptodrosophila lebanonensis]|uniref:Uncharacterized protein LOC115626139 isoform X2 n=1 Tax=Drosophila lebanonensis TaxID=7225 RepID=A0A6J2TQM7_DROLE|nr:uncharacterized protein LOC115626139 isoform X2 [Scaptodrosophila lebanonensis]